MSEPVRLRLGALAIRQARQPTKGLRLLAGVQRDRLTPKDAALYDALLVEGERLRQEDPLEFADD